MPWQLDLNGPVFVDTSAFFAMAVRRDQHNRAAHELRRRLVTERTSLVTSNFVAAELHALMLTRIGAKEANEVLRELDKSDTAILRANLADELRARDIVSRFADHQYSLTDAISFAVMDRLGIRRAFTFDDHFARYGITIPVEI
jgi:predicted nucleic acid-binding protein